MHIHNYPINATRCLEDVIECTGIITIINLLAIDHGLLCYGYMCGELRFVLHGSWIHVFEYQGSIMLRCCQGLCECVVEDKGPSSIVISSNWEGYCVRYKIKGWGIEVYAP
jgi:hypothetical protein